MRFNDAATGSYMIRSLGMCCDYSEHKCRTGMCPADPQHVLASHEPCPFTTDGRVCKDVQASENANAKYGSSVEQQSEKNCLEASARERMTFYIPGDNLTIETEISPLSASYSIYQLKLRTTYNNAQP